MKGEFNMLKIITIVGARPQIIKAAALSRAIKENFSSEIEEIIVHTGQHYDENMSEQFFQELSIPKPKYNLGVGSQSHASQTANIILQLEKILLDEKPKVLVVYGDTNSTIAASLTAAKMGIAVAHIEAGLRSFNKNMPEEINRIATDHVSTLLFSPTHNGVQNLENEGFSLNNKAPFSMDNPAIYHCGDVMYDNTLFFSQLAEGKSEILEKHSLEKNNFTLCTIHRDYNTDNPSRMQSIFQALSFLAKEKNQKIFLPLHPRTSKNLEKSLGKSLYEDVVKNKNIIISGPVSFLEMTLLEKHSKLIATDSGGVQKEACFFKKPLLILRSETEWVELVEAKSASIVDANKDLIISQFERLLQSDNLVFPDIFGDGKAAVFIANKILEYDRQGNN
ncbi:MAG: non-hydrolyzing UDP-N-acetylglucosamine 2-epimerase [Bacteroidales bacterium]|jgi:UDP-GlcNAc3NAcA epimerase